MSAAEARAILFAAIGEWDSADLILLARIARFGTRAALRAELRALRETEGQGDPRGFAPTPRAVFVKGLALGLLDALAGDRR